MSATPSNHQLPILSDLLEEEQLHALREDDEQGLASARTQSLYRRSTHWLAPSLVAAWLLAYVLMDSVQIDQLILWLTIISCIIFSQLLLVWLFHRAVHWQQQHQRWRKGLVLGWILTGLCWGIASVLLFPHQSEPHQVFMVLAITGFTMGLVPPLSMIPCAALGFLAASMGPLVFNLLWQPGSDLQEKMGHVLLIIFLALGVMAVQIAKTAARSLQLKLENHTTLNKVEMLNESLQDEIRERWAVEQELNKAKEEAESAARAKGNFLATMSHEIRTPMNGVLGMLELLKDMKMGTEQRDLANTAHYSAESLLSIINDVLDFSKIEMGELELESIELNLLRTLKDVAALMRHRVKEKGIYVRMGQLESGIPHIVIGDPTRLRQILINLVGNAVKFTNQGGVDVGVILLRRTPGSVVLRFEVRDTGVGIPAETLDNLFQPFAQADSSMARKYGGTGLGLSIAKHLVTLMGGQIGAESQSGNGSLFWFSIPLRIPGQAETPLRQNIAATRVLLIGCESKEKQTIISLLQGWKASVDSAGSTNEALVKMARLASIGKSWLYEAVILCSTIAYKDRQLLVGTMRNDALFSGTTLIAFAKEEDIPGKTHLSNTLLWQTLPVNAKQLFGALVENTSGPGTAVATQQNQETMEVPVHDLPAFEVGTSDRSEGESLLVDLEIAPPAEPEEQEDSVATGLRTSRVLVVEDNLINQKVANRMLGKMGMQVTLANDGRQAVEMSGKTDYALIFMDCQMPVMDGFEATRRIRTREKKAATSRIPIIAMTASVLEGDKERCLQAGMTDYLAKPFKREVLADLLHQYLPTPGEQECSSQELVPIAKSARLLLVEDNLINQKVARNLLIKIGFEVDTANDGFEGVDAVKDSNYAAILMDCQMPGMDGYQATRTIRTWEQETGHARTPVIAVTANAMKGDRERCLEFGMDDYLAKPIKRTGLAEMLEKWIPHNIQEEELRMTNQNTDDHQQAVDQAILDELQELMEDDFPELVKIYLKDTPQLLLEIRDAIKDANDDALRSSAHTFKSSSANMGALNLSALAKELELLGRNGTTHGAATLFNQALAEFKQVKEVLQARL